MIYRFRFREHCGSRYIMHYVHCNTGFRHIDASVFDRKSRAAAAHTANNYRCYCTDAQPRNSQLLSDSSHGIVERHHWSTHAINGRGSRQPIGVVDRTMHRRRTWDGGNEKLI